MTDVKNLFVLTWAPMQAVSALEARAHFGLNPSSCVLLAEPRVRDLGLFEAPAWSDIQWLPIRCRESAPGRLRHWMRFRVAVRQLIQRHGAFERIFVGHLGDPMRHIVHTCSPREVFVLDAGLVTPEEAHERSVARTLSGVASWRQHVKRSVLGLRTWPVEQVAYFSAYDFGVDFPDRVIRHRYEHLAANFDAIPDSGETWIVGQNFVEGGMLSATKYQAYVREALRIATGKPVYVAHPREEKDRLSAIGLELGVEVRRFGRPLEIELLKSGERPRSIVGFNSSALQSSHVIGQGIVPVTAVRIHVSDVLRLRETFSLGYETLTKAGVRVVSVDTGV